MGSVMSIDEVMQSRHELKGFTKDIYGTLVGYECRDSYELNKDQENPVVFIKLKGTMHEMFGYGEISEGLIDFLEQKKDKRIYFSAEIDELLAITGVHP